MNKVETFIFGEIVGHPICTFTEVREQSVLIGLVYPVKTTQLIDYEIQEVVTWICSVYDLKKFNILHKGDRVKLSVLQSQNSTYSPDGKALKCNVVSKDKVK